MATLERLIPDADKPRLRKAVDKRYSCRAYERPLSIGDWSALSYSLGRYSMAGARLVLLRVPEALFSGTLLSMNRVTGCTAAAAVVVTQGVREARIRAGILGELFCLEAADAGMATCWLTGSYRKKLLEVPVTPREEVLGIIAVGWPQESAAKPRRRKPLEHLCTSDPTFWPPMCLRAAELIRQAPSAMNLQPWMISYEKGIFAVDAAQQSHLDLGIALSHAALAFTGTTPWEILRSNYDPAAFIELT